MGKNIDFEYFKEMYYKTLEERTYIRERTNLPFSIFSTFSIIAMIHFYNVIWNMDSLNNCTSVLKSIWFVYTLLIIGFVIIFAFLVGKTVLLGLPTAQSIMEQRNDLCKYYEFLNSENPLYLANRELEENLTDVYIKCIDDVTRSNAQKIRLLYASQYILYCSMGIVLLLSLIIYIF